MIREGEIFTELSRMSLRLESARDVYARVLAHSLTCIGNATVWDSPFSHTYFEEIFPADVYAALLANLPSADCYWSGPQDPNTRYKGRTLYNLTVNGVRGFPVRCRNLWLGVVAALTDPMLKRCLYAKLVPDLIHRYGVEEAVVPDLAGFSRPTLYRDSEVFAIPPHPDTLKKVVTMHLYLPADLSQIHLGTALYERMSGPLFRDDWRASFTVVKQFEFRPNSGYAFVVNNSGSRESWHGREPIPAGSGVRQTLLNTFYTEARREYAGYFEE
jgi:hypothetical protein